MGRNQYIRHSDEFQILYDWDRNYSLYSFDQQSVLCFTLVNIRDRMKRLRQVLLLRAQLKANRNKSVQVRLCKSFQRRLMVKNTITRRDFCSRPQKMYSSHGEPSDFAGISYGHVIIHQSCGKANEIRHFPECNLKNNQHL